MKYHIDCDQGLGLDFSLFFFGPVDRLIYYLLPVHIAEPLMLSLLWYYENFVI